MIIHSTLHNAPRWMRATLTLGLALLAVLGNALSLPLTFGVDFIFGSIAVMLAVVLLGTWPAVLVAFTGSLYTLVLWGHPYAMLIFTSEALVVGLLYRHLAGNLALASLAYWLFIGMPLILQLYQNMLGMAWESALLIALKQPLNGLFNALLAGALLLAIQSQDWGQRLLKASAPRFSAVLFHILLGSILLACAVPIIYASHVARLDQEAFVASTLRMRAEYLARYLQANPQINIDQRLDSAEEAPGLTLAILNKQGRAIVRKGTLASLDAQQGELQTIHGDLSVWLPNTEHPLLQRWKHARYQLQLALPASSPYGSIVVEMPALELVNRLEQSRQDFFLFLAGLVALGTLLASMISQALTRPLKKLALASQVLPEEIARGQTPDLPQSQIEEYSDLTHSLQNMATLLAGLFLKQQQTQVGLEKQVKARTVELQDSNDLLRNVLAAASEIGIIATDANGLISLFNSGAQRMLGYEPDELVGKHTTAILHVAEELEAHRSMISKKLGKPISALQALGGKAIRDGAATGEWTYVHKDGRHIPVAATLTPIRNSGGTITGFLGIVIDISERQRIDRLKSEFVSTVSHELRTPLTAIAGSLGLIAGGALGELPEKAMHMVQLAQQNAQRLTLLINDLLDMEKLVAGQMDLNLQLQPLAAILDKAVELNRPYGIEHNVDLALSEVATELLVNVDRHRLLQALSNLLSNAIKFSPAHGQVELYCTVDGSRVRISVRDHGEGVAENFRERIFQKFAQADSSNTRRKGGTGLGLAITRELVERMHGEVGFDSVVGAGATFWISLPLAHPEQG